jgi:peptide-methionine (S)-S-oxide reductase
LRAQPPKPSRLGTQRCEIAIGASTARELSFPDATVDNKNLKGKQVAVLAGGCFWYVEAVFQQIEGVKKVVSGYSGSDAASARYEIVSTGRTGHAESVQITFDPQKISYGQILKVFFDVAHDPTQLNRQGPDTGTQYRSAIFYTNVEQKRIAEAYIQQLDQAKVFGSPIVTHVVEFKAFYPAEELHQNFCKRNPRNPYVMGVAMPKVEKVRQKVPELASRSRSFRVSVAARSNSIRASSVRPSFLRKSPRTLGNR